jgi:hypothetical protein
MSKRKILLGSHRRHDASASSANAATSNHDGSARRAGRS